MAVSPDAVPNIVRAVLEHVAVKYGPLRAKAKAFETLERIRLEREEMRGGGADESSEEGAATVEEATEPTETTETTETTEEPVGRMPAASRPPPVCRRRTGGERLVERNWADMASSGDEEG